MRKPGPASLPLCLLRLRQRAAPACTLGASRFTTIAHRAGQRRPDEATVEKLVSFGTRHTLSSMTDPKRGIGAALNYAEAEFKAVGLPVVRPCATFTGERILKPSLVCDVVAMQRGTERPNDVVIITGHIDSRASDPIDAKSEPPAPMTTAPVPPRCSRPRGCCRKLKFPGTIVYAALSGEEQGLYGGKILADLAKTLGWNVIANLNNDIIGNSCGSDKVCDDKAVRVFSEGLRWQGGELLRADVRKFGGENDSPSRNLSRFLDTLAEQLPNRPRRPPDLAQRPLRPRRRPHRIPECRLSRGPPDRRGRGL